MKTRVKYDYMIVSEFGGPDHVRTTTYQRLINALGIADASFMSAPLKEGGVPQVQYVVEKVRDMMPGVTKIEVLYNGNQILSVGRKP